jgi:Fis family transcriptional regulator
MANANERPGFDALSEVAKRALQDHLDTLTENDAENIYRIMLDAIERPMLEIMMRYTHDNQSRAAQCLGINRATLRTKLKRHNLL